MKVRFQASLPPARQIRNDVNPPLLRRSSTGKVSSGARVRIRAPAVGCLICAVNSHSLGGDRTREINLNQPFPVAEEIKPQAIALILIAAALEWCDVLG